MENNTSGDRKFNSQVMDMKSLDGTYSDISSIDRRMTETNFSREERKKKAKKGVRYNFKSPSRFQNATSCFICEKKFSFGIKRHHCRLCAKSVCKECSSKKISDNRVGDICYMKHSNQKLEVQKKNYLKHLASWTKDLNKKIKVLKKNIMEKEQKKDKLALQIDLNAEETKNRITDMERSIGNLKEIKASKERERKSLEESIRRRQEMLNQKNLELRDLESQITIMELNLQMQEDNYNGKTQRRDALKKHLADLKTSEETLRMTIGDDELKLELIDGLMRKSMRLKEDESQSSLYDERLV